MLIESKNLWHKLENLGGEVLSFSSQLPLERVKYLSWESILYVVEYLSVLLPALYDITLYLFPSAMTTRVYLLRAWCLLGNKISPCQRRACWSKRTVTIPSSLSWVVALPRYFLQAISDPGSAGWLYLTGTKELNWFWEILGGELAGLY